MHLPRATQALEGRGFAQRSSFFYTVHKHERESIVNALVLHFYSILKIRGFGLNGKKSFSRIISRIYKMNVMIINSMEEDRAVSELSAVVCACAVGAFCTGVLWTQAFPHLLVFWSSSSNSSSSCKRYALLVAR